MPERFWDKDKGVKAKEFGDHLSGLETRVAADDVRRNSLPQAPDAYKIELPADFKAPAGTEFKFNDADPLLAQARQVMHEIDTGKLSGQAAFSKLLGLYAGARVGEEAQVATARAGELQKLGPTAPARIDAVTRWTDSIDGTADKSHSKALQQMLVTSRQVEALEYLINRFTAQGGTSFSQQHREHGQENGKIPGYDTMSFEQRRRAQDQIAAAARR